jgi:hypothetical protein
MKKYHFLNQQNVDIVTETDHMVLNHIRNIPDENIISISQRNEDMCIIVIDDTDFSKVKKESRKRLSSKDLLSDKTYRTCDDEPVLMRP